MYNPNYYNFDLQGVYGHEGVLYGIGQYEDEMDRIIIRINEQIPYIFDQMMKYGINRSVGRWIVRYVITFVLKNYGNYSGSPQEVTEALIKDFYTQSPWILLMMQSYGMPIESINGIIRVLIIFTLSQIGYPYPPDPSQNIRQLARRITRSIRQDTDIFISLEAYGIPRNQVRNIVFTVVRFTLKRLDFSDYPRNFSKKTRQIIRQLERSNLDVIKDLEAYGLNQREIRGTLRQIILFTLNAVYKEPRVTE